MSVDDASFRDFVFGAHRRLVNFAEFVTGDLGRGEDLVQSAYVKTYAKWSSVAARNPEAYVRACIINGRTDWWRRRASTEQVTETHRLMDVADRSDRTADVDQRLLVFAALDRLTQRERTVIVLRYYVNLSETEIAAELGLAPGTVKSTASRAVAKLRDDPALSEGA